MSARHQLDYIIYMLKRDTGSKKPRTVYLDWLLKTEAVTMGYEELNMLANINEDENPPYWQNTTEEEVRWDTESQTSAAAV